MKDGLWSISGDDVESGRKLVTKDLVGRRKRMLKRMSCGRVKIVGDIDWVVG